MVVKQLTLWVFRLVAASPVAEKQLLLTKGDNNSIDDLELYQGLEWLERKHIVGKVRGFLPYVGYVTIAMVRLPLARSQQHESEQSLMFLRSYRTTSHS